MESNPVSNLKNDAELEEDRPRRALKNLFQDVSIITEGIAPYFSVLQNLRCNFGRCLLTLRCIC